MLSTSSVTKTRSIASANATSAAAPMPVIVSVFGMTPMSQRSDRRKMRSTPNSLDGHLSPWSRGERSEIL